LQLCARVSKLQVLFDILEILLPFALPSEDRHTNNTGHLEFACEQVVQIIPAMASLNTSQNGPSITKSYQSVVDSPPPSGPAAKSSTYGQWVVLTVAAPLVSAFQNEGGKESVLKVQSTGGM
jgi:hypothetical protein